MEETGRRCKHVLYPHERVVHDRVMMTCSEHAPDVAIDEIGTRGLAPLGSLEAEISANGELPRRVDDGRDAFEVWFPDSIQAIGYRQDLLQLLRL